MKYKIALVSFAVLFFACTRLVKPPVDINGYWMRGRRTRIIIDNYKGVIVGENGESIGADIEYLSEERIKITEKDHTPKFIANYGPERVADIIFTNELVKNTYYILTPMEDENKISVFVSAWQAYFDFEYDVYYVMSFTNSEVWTRIIEEN